MYDQLAPGGTLIIYDVIGPENKDSPILMELNDKDGADEGWNRVFDDNKGTEVSELLSGLSTYTKFLRFAQDFRKEEGYELKHNVLEKDDRKYVELSLRDAIEFLGKKDYTDNWYSEMHETFCFWDFDDWKSELEKIGFRIRNGSGLMTNPWVIENRYKNCAELFDKEMNPLPYPPTNVVIFAEKI